jgi:hypothetical protein
MDDDIDAILDALQDSDGLDVIHVGTLPASAMALWPSRVTDEVVITRIQRNHYLANHPELIDYEREIVNAVRNPERIYRLRDSQLTIMCCFSQDRQHDIAVIVSIAADKALRNSVITARRQRRNRTGKPIHRHELIWIKGVE